MAGAADKQTFPQKAKAWWADARANRYFRLGLAGAALLALIAPAV